MAGTIIIGLYSIFLMFINKVATSSKQGINTFLFTNKKIGGAVLIPGIFSSWLWTTSIIGAAEACILHGKFGGVAFAVGTGLGFIAFLIILLKLRDTTKNNVYVSDFIKERFGNKAEIMFHVTAVLLVVYIVIEQAVGMSALFASVLNISFKNFAFFSVMSAVLFVIMAGMKGVLIHDIFSFLVVGIGLLVMFTLIIDRITPDGVANSVEIAQNYTQHTGENKGFWVGESLRYGVSALVIGLAQVCLDPIYYFKSAMAKNKKTIVVSFLVGGVLIWAPLVILSSFFFGLVPVALNAELGEATHFITVIVNKVLIGKWIYVSRFIFCLVIMFIGFSTIINSFMGIQGVAITKIYPMYANEKATVVQQMEYGKIITVMIGIFCAMIAISLENVSLLKIDIFSGIFFAAPASIFMCGLYGKKEYGNLAIGAFAVGIATGFGAWLFIKDTSVDWFYGTMLSFLVPVLFLIIFSYIGKKKNFDFDALK